VLELITSGKPPDEPSMIFSLLLDASLFIHLTLRGCWSSWWST